MAARPPLSVLLISAYFPPDTGSAAHLFYELGAALVARGHRVAVVTGMPGYHAQGPLERYHGRLWLREGVEGMDVLRVAVPRPPRRVMVGRALWQLSSAAALFLGALRQPRSDVAMVYSPPLPLGLSAWALRRLRGTPFVLNVQDLFPRSVIDLGLLRSHAIIRLFEALERFVYRRATAIVVHSAGNRAHIVGKGAAVEKVAVVPNWVDTDFIRPGERMNGIRAQHGLGDAFVVSFAGVLGYAQDLDVVLEAARRLGDQPAPGSRPLVWLIVGDGVEKPRLEQKARAMGLDNVRFLPMQPRHAYPAVLQASDVSLTTLQRSVRTPVVPSKIVSIMAAGRPVVAALDLGGDAPRLVAEARCGLCVSAADAGALADAVLALYRDPALCAELGHSGRRYAEEHLSLAACAARYEALFRDIVARRAGKMHVAPGHDRV